MLNFYWLLNCPIWPVRSQIFVIGQVKLDSLDLKKSIKPKLSHNIRTFCYSHNYSLNVVHLVLLPLQISLEKPISHSSLHDSCDIDFSHEIYRGIHRLCNEFYYRVDIMSQGTEAPLLVSFK